MITNEHTNLNDIKLAVKRNEDIVVTREFLVNHPDYIFVFGDNEQRIGKGGAAQAARGLPNGYGFITKIKPDNNNNSFYLPKEYAEIYKREIETLESVITHEPDKTFLISQVGAGLANRFGIFSKVIAPHIKNDLQYFPNVIFLW